MAAYYIKIICYNMLLWIVDLFYISWAPNFPFCWHEPHIARFGPLDAYMDTTLGTAVLEWQQNLVKTTRSFPNNETLCPASYLESNPDDTLVKGFFKRTHYCREQCERRYIEPHYLLPCIVMRGSKVVPPHGTAFCIHIEVILQFCHILLSMPLTLDGYHWYEIMAILVEFCSWQRSASFLLIKTY